MFVVVGIQKSHFKVKKETWVFDAGATSPQTIQPELNRHAVTVVDGPFYHYDGHHGTLNKH